MYWRCNIAPEEMKMAMRHGDWKILADTKLTKFEIYNLKTDPNQTTELSVRDPQQLESLKNMLIKLNTDIEKEGPDWWRNYQEKKKKKKAKT